MVNNSYYKCLFCGETLRFRYQVGFFNIPVSIYCPKCNCHIFGKIYIGQSKSSIIEVIFGAEKIDDENCNYLIELSTEFLVHKCKKNEPNQPDISMFMRSDPFDEERTKRRNNLMYLAQNADYTIGIIENLFNLLNNEQISLIRDFFLKTNNPIVVSLKQHCDYNKIVNKVDAMLAIKHFINSILLPTMPPLVFKNMYKIMDTKVRKIIINHSNEFINYLRYINDDYLETYLYRFPKFFCDYIKCIEQLIPIYDNFSKFDTIDLTINGISTLSIDELSTIYKKGYELLCDSIDLIAGLDNIESRGKFNDFGNGREDFKNKIDSFNSKYKKYTTFVNNKSDLFDGIRNILNNIIRNAEGHNSIAIDGLNQIVVFKNKHKGKTNKIEVSFLEFGKMIIDLYIALLYVWEYLYQLIKFKTTLVNRIKLNYGL